MSFQVDRTEESCCNIFQYLFKLFKLFYLPSSHLIKFYYTSNFRPFTLSAFIITTASCVLQIVVVRVDRDVTISSRHEYDAFEYAPKWMPYIKYCKTFSSIFLKLSEKQTKNLVFSSKTLSIQNEIDYKLQSKIIKKRCTKTFCWIFFKKSDECDLAARLLMSNPERLQTCRYWVKGEHSRCQLATPPDTLQPPSAVTMLKLSFLVLGETISRLQVHEISKVLWLNSGSAAMSVAKHKAQSKGRCWGKCRFMWIIRYELSLIKFLSNIHVKKCKKVFFPFCLRIEYFLPKCVWILIILGNG